MSILVLQKLSFRTVHGKAINIVISSEKEIFFFPVLKSFLAIAPDKAGTKAVANAMLKDKGSVTNVSTFPLKIP